MAVDYYVDHDEARRVFQGSLSTGKPRMLTVSASPQKGKSKFINWCYDQVVAQHALIIKIDLKGFSDATGVEFLEEIVFAVGIANCPNYGHTMDAVIKTLYQININITENELSNSRIEQIQAILNVNDLTPYISQLTNALISDLAKLALKQRVFFLLDHFEAIKNSLTFKGWVIRLIHRLVDIDGCVSIVAGNETPHLKYEANREICYPIKLPERLQWKHWEEYAMHLGMLNALIATEAWKNFFNEFGGDPSKMAYYAEIVRNPNYN